MPPTHLNQVEVYVVSARPEAAHGPDRLLGALRYVLILAAPILLAAVACKLHKQQAMTDGLTPALAAGLLARDLAFAALWLAGWSVLLARAQGRLGGLVLGALHLGTFLGLAYTVIEHAFFLVTGTFMDWDLLGYSFEQLDKLERLILSEVGPGTVVAFLAVVALALWPLALARLRPVDGPLRWRGRWTERPLQAFGALLIGLLLPMALTAGVAIPDRLEQARANPMAALAQGAAASFTRTLRRGTAPVAVKPVEPLVVARTADTRLHNVVLIVLESERAQSMTPWAPELNTTPFLNDLAAKGSVAERAYTVVPHTSKSLVPIHCGIYPRIIQSVVEVSPNALPSDCLARVLRRQGYSTGFVQAPESIFERRTELIGAFGFETFLSRDDLPKEGFEDSSYFGYEDDVMLQPTLDWVDQQRQPFFLGMLTLVSHHFYKVPKSIDKQKLADEPRLNDYLNTIRYEDRFLKKLYAGFEERGLIDNTLFIIVGDHGEAFGEHGLWQHGDTYHEEGIWVPLLLAGAGVDKLPRRVGGLRQHIDIMPTILQALGLQIAAGELPGIPLFEPKGHDLLHFSCWRNDSCLAIRDRQQKTIYHYGKRKPEVFDLVADPGETVNLLSTGAITAAEVEARVAAMKAWREQVNARYESQAKRRTQSYVSRQRPKVQHPVSIRLDDFVRLIGYDLQHASITSGDPNWITFYFEVLKKPTPGWQLFVHVVGPGAMLNADHVPVEGSYPIDQWQPGEFITDRTWLRIKPQRPSGPYAVNIGLYNEKENSRRALPIREPLPDDLEVGTQPSGRSWAAAVGNMRQIVVTTIDVHNPLVPYTPRPDTGAAGLPAKARPYVHAAVPKDVGTRMDVRFDDVIQLHGVEVPEGRVTLGSPVTLTYHIEVLKRPTPTTELFVHVVGPQQAYHNAVHVPVEGTYPVDRWHAGEFLEDRHVITLPADMATGEYKVWLGFWDPNAMTPFGRLNPVARPWVEAVERRVLVASLNFVKKGQRDAPHPHE